MRDPVAPLTALAMAAAIGTMAGSPAPVDWVVGSPARTTSIWGVSVMRGALLLPWL